MSESPAEIKRIHWSDVFAFTAVFRSFRMALDWKTLLLAFLGLFVTYLGGRTLDLVWASNHMPIVSSAHVSELDAYAMGGRSGAKQFIKEQGGDKAARRVGAFALLLQHARVTANRAMHGVMALNPGEVLGAIYGAALATLWLVSVHPLYGVLFVLLKLSVWALFGGAACRVAMMRATRDERIPLSEALAFARARFGSFLLAPTFGFGIVLIAGLVLMLFGLVGAIPWLGDLVVGLLFVLVIAAALGMAFILIGACAGMPLLYPAIAAEGSDPFDAINRSISYIYERPWRSALYLGAATAYGAICLLFVKFFVRLGLAAAALFLGATMNLGSATAGDTKLPDDVGKLTAIWQAPTLTFDNAFVGGFDEYEVGGMSRFGRFLIKGWLYAVWGLVAAFAISFYYAAASIVYLLLRREVDATDIEDVYMEDYPADALATAPAPAGNAPAAQGGGLNLPVIGS